MSKRALFLALLLGRIPFCRAFKVPGENGLELPPKIRPDILQETKSDLSRGDSPIASHRRRQRKSKRDAKHWKKNAEKFSDPDYWNEVIERLRWREERKLRMVRARRSALNSRRRQKLLGVAGQILAVVLICSPVLLTLLPLAVVMAACILPALPIYVMELLLRTGPWAIAGFALYKVVELVLLEGKSTPLFVAKDYVDDEVDYTDDDDDDTDDDIYSSD